MAPERWVGLDSRGPCTNHVSAERSQEYCVFSQIYFQRSALSYIPYSILYLRLPSFAALKGSPAQDRLEKTNEASDKACPRIPSLSDLSIPALKTPPLAIQAV